MVLLRGAGKKKTEQKDSQPYYSSILVFLKAHVYAVGFIAIKFNPQLIMLLCNTCSCTPSPVSDYSVHTFIYSTFQFSVMYLIINHQLATNFKFTVSPLCDNRQKPNSERSVTAFRFLRPYFNTVSKIQLQQEK